MAFKMNGWSAFTKTGDGKLTKMTSLSKMIKNIKKGNKKGEGKEEKEADYLEKRKTYTYTPQSIKNKPAAQAYPPGYTKEDFKK